jgi:predicted Zn-dependent protease with MMP-like domain
MLSVAECERAAREALDSLPDELVERMGPVAVIVEESHPEDLMGIYDPVGGIERIVIFREANESLDDVRTTVLHEVGHYFGMDEEHLEELGYG